MLAFLASRSIARDNNRDRTAGRSFQTFGVRSDLVTINGVIDEKLVPWLPLRVPEAERDCASQQMRSANVSHGSWSCKNPHGLGYRRFVDLTKSVPIQF